MYKKKFKRLLEQTNCYSHDEIESILKQENIRYDENTKVLQKVLRYQYGINLEIFFSKDKYNLNTTQKRLSTYESIQPALRGLVSDLYRYTKDVDTSLYKFSELIESGMYRETPKLAYLKLLFQYFNKSLQNTDLLSQNVVLINHMLNSGDKEIYADILIAKNKHELDKIDLWNLYKDSVNPQSFDSEKTFKILHNTTTTLIRYLANSKKISQEDIDKIGNIISEKYESLKMLDMSNTCIDECINRSVQTHILFGKSIDKMDKKELEKLGDQIKEFQKLSRNTEILKMEGKEVSDIVCQYIYNVENMRNN